MTGTTNDPYRRRFANPALRPSNLPFAQWAAAETLRTVRGLNEWLDGVQAAEVVGEAERLTRAEADRLDRLRAWKTSGDVQAGDPGE